MTPQDTRPIPAVIVDPTATNDLDTTRNRVLHACARHGWSEPVWLETSSVIDAPSQTRIAMTHEADIIMALGNPPTITSVAETLLGEDVAMGLLPTSRPHHVATALGLPTSNLEAAVAVCLTGDDHPITPATIHMHHSPTTTPDVVAFGDLTVAVTHHPGGPQHTATTITCDGAAFQVTTASHITIHPEALQPPQTATLAPLRRGFQVAATPHVIPAQQHVQTITFLGDLDNAVYHDNHLIAMASALTISQPEHHLVIRVPATDPINSLLDDETTQHHQQRVASGSIDLRPFDNPS